MLQRFKDFISEHQLFKPEHQLLLALSGGADSVFLFHLLKKSGFNFTVAHCNYKLRGDESDADEKFVINLAKINDVPYFTTSFDTKIISLKYKTGIQETARKLRYDWFFMLMEQMGFDKLLTAHHQTDNMETMLINILRNTGIKGLHGIPLDENKIARPLLFTNKSAIEAYLLSENVAYREDKSNNSNDYLRNELRHLVLPAFKGIQTDVEQCFFETSKKVKSYEIIANELIDKQWKDIVIEEAGCQKIDSEKLNLIENRIPFLFYNLQAFGFTYAQIKSILNVSQIGKKIISGSHELSVERNYLLLEKISEVLIEEVIIGDETIGEFTISNKKIQIEIIGKLENLNVKRKDVLFLNADKIDFPVKIRVWKDGDKLKPLGMSGYKKVSDILTDKKVDNHKRKHFLVVENSNNQIIALLPDTIHDDYKVNLESSKILVIGIKIVA